MNEMLACTNETSAHFRIEDRIDIVGHSRGSLCALAYSIENPARIKRLFLIGSTSAWSSVSKWGMHKHWSMANLKIHKKLSQLIEYAY